MAGESATHAATLTLADGRTYRFGPDEASVGNVPTAVTFDTVIPGGFDTGQITLPRPDPLTALDASLFSSIRIYRAASNQTFYEGRITGTPQVGDSQIEIQCEGWAKHLSDDETARQIFYDRDLSSWGGMSVQRQINLITAGFGIGDGQTTPDPTTGSAALETGFDGSWTPSQVAEGWYDADGLDITAIDYAWKKSSNVDNTDTNWSWTLLGSTDDILTASDTTGTLRAAGPGSGTLTTSAALRKFACAQLVYGSVGGVDGSRYSLYWTLLAVIGNHGLTLRGTVSTPATGRGLLVSDMAPYIVRRWAPLLSVAPDSIEPTNFVIPHSVYKEDTTAQSMIEGLALLGGSSDYPLDWGVYDNRTFFMKSPGNYGQIWRVRRDQATQSSDDGPDSSTRLNGVKVTYDDGTGTKRSVGPPGSGADYETAVLADTKTSNPANQDGARHWKIYDAGITSGPVTGMTTAQKDYTGAVLIGRLKLADANRAEWRGSVTIQGETTDSSGNTYPAAMVRAGDQVVVEDDPDTRPRRIIQTSYSPVSVQASVGAKPDVLDSLLARLGVVLQGRL